MPEAENIPQRLGRLITSPKAYANQKTLLAGFGGFARTGRSVGSNPKASIRSGW